MHFDVVRRRPLRSLEIRPYGPDRDRGDTFLRTSHRWYVASALVLVSVSVGPRSLDAMTAQPLEPDRLDTGPMPAVERAATIEQREDAEDWAAVREWQRREAAGESVYVPIDEARRRLGLGRRR